MARKVWTLPSTHASSGAPEPPSKGSPPDAGSPRHCILRAVVGPGVLSPAWICLCHVLEGHVGLGYEPTSSRFVGRRCSGGVQGKLVWPSMVMVTAGLCSFFPDSSG